MPSVNELAKIIWDYHHLHQTLKKSDLIFVLGSHDIRVAEYASELFLQGYAPLILFSGNEGAGREVSGFKGTPEAERFAQIALEMGVPQESILMEKEARNTGQNILLSHKLLQDRRIKIDSIIAVQKPYMERRTFATLKAQWPEPQPEFTVTSQDISFDDYINNPLYPADYTINVMVGDLQRIKEYPKQGFQIRQEIPPDVWGAWEQLVEKGYDKHLIKE